MRFRYGIPGIRSNRNWTELHGITRNYTEFWEWSALIPESDEGIPESDKVIPEFDEVIPESDSVHVWCNSGIDGTDSGGGTGSGMFNIAE